MVADDGQCHAHGGISEANNMVKGVFLGEEERRERPRILFLLFFSTANRVKGKNFCGCR